MAVHYPELPFAIDSLEPFMSKKTLEFHYGKHHKKYVDTANTLIAGTDYEDMNEENILLRSHGVDQQIFNNAAQAWNHTFFWDCLRNGIEPSAKMIEAIKKNFGGMEAFQKQFSETATKLFGSGWTWLVKDIKGNLSIRGTKDAENPMVDGEVPLLVCDVWEHAYYLDYQNERPKFLENFWSIVNWDFVEANLARALPKGDFAKPAANAGEARVSH